MAKTEINLKVRIPHILIDTRGADPALVEALAPGLEQLDARVRILGKGAEQIPHVFSAEDALEEADMWVFLGGKLPADFPTIIEHGIVPVLKEGAHAKAENYSAAKEKGNSFIFPQSTEWHVYASLVRALENFAFVYDWKSLKGNTKELMVNLES